MVGGVIKHLCKPIGTKKVNTTSHHPQTGGQVERCNKTLVDMLQKELIGEEQWSDLVPLVTFQYNTSQHRATLKTPYDAMSGEQRCHKHSVIYLERFLSRYITECL